MTCLDKSRIPTPALLLDLDILTSNIREMAKYLEGKGVALRPHTKCHKIPMIARLQIRAGAKGIMVAKLGEAEVMADAGIDDIAIGNQIVQEAKIEKLASLNEYSSVSVAVDNPIVVSMLSSIASRKGVKVRTIVEVDVGMNRCGVLPRKPALDLAKKVDSSASLIFGGLMGYEGENAFIESFEERKKRCHKCYQELVDTKKMIEKAGFEVGTVSTGGTASYSLAAEYPGITEIEAGSYVFMDQEHNLEGIPFNVSLTVMSTVISRPAKDRAIIDGGLKTFSSYMTPKAKGITGVEVLKLHEEHGILRLNNPSSNLNVGDTIEFIPSCSSMTMNLHDKVYVLRGGRVESVWNVAARGRTD